MSSNETLSRGPTRATVLVTGGTGTLGRQVVARLARHGYTTTPNNRYGKITWEVWLRRKYDLPTESAPTGTLNTNASKPTPETLP